MQAQSRVEHHAPVYSFCIAQQAGSLPRQAASREAMRGIGHEAGK